MKDPLIPLNVFPPGLNSEFRGSEVKAFSLFLKVTQYLVALTLLHIHSAVLFPINCSHWCVRISESPNAQKTIEFENTKPTTTFPSLPPARLSQIKAAQRKSYPVHTNTRFFTCTQFYFKSDCVSAAHFVSGFPFNQIMQNNRGVTSVL